MTDNNRFSRKKLWNYFWNGLLVLVVLIFIVPSWRIAFQGWWQGLFMSDVEFSANADVPIPAEGQNWALFNMKSEMISFAEFGDKPVILSFWATWCPPCRAELPELLEIHDRYKNQLNVVAVSEETIEQIEDSGLPDTYPFLYSTPGVPAFYDVKVYPTLLIIDDGMRLVFRSEGVGNMDTEKNHAFLQNLIDKE